jgi:hypothetical protein
MDKTAIVTPAGIVTDNYNLKEQICLLSALIEDMKTNNTKNLEKGSHRNMALIWYTDCDESQYTSSNMWELFHMLIVAHDIVPLFDIDDDTDPKAIFSSTIKIYAVLKDDALIYVAELCNTDKL